jgi:hypothetical protein
MSRAVLTGIFQDLLQMGLCIGQMSDLKFVEPKIPQGRIEPRVELDGLAKVSIGFLKHTGRRKCDPEQIVRLHIVGGLRQDLLEQNDRPKWLALLHIGGCLFVRSQSWLGLCQARTANEREEKEYSTLPLNS